MIKNDYRRSLIMLRIHELGYSGHVRLERRTLMGSMYVSINAPSDGSSLCAALVRRDSRGAYYAVRMGALRRDGRGQATLAYSFDPRNIDGHPLEDYILITIVTTNDEDICNVALSGNVNGSYDVEWRSVRPAVCAVCAEAREPGCGSCSAPNPAPVRPNPTPVRPNPTPPQGCPGSCTEFPIVPSKPIQPRQSGAEAEPAPELPEPEEAPAEEISIEEVPADDLPEPTEESAPATPDPTPTAAQILGMDAGSPWPGAAENVRALFASQPAKELMLNDGYTYVEAPMPEDSGYDAVEVGLRAQDGRIVSVSYALPSTFTPEPPPGLEGYRWQGGAASGWWTLETDADTGEPL